MAPTPKNSTVVSLVPQITGVPAASPVRRAASGVTVPITASAGLIGGNSDISSPIRAQSAGDQLCVALSASKAPMASEKSVSQVPVRRERR
jgi:hypothetical protein